MKKAWLIILLVLWYGIMAFKTEHSQYKSYYLKSIDQLNESLQHLALTIRTSDDVTEIKHDIDECRLCMKRADIWLRYLEPIKYKKINGPLPVEWENEVFEKYEKPYKREGAGLTLCEQYIARSQRDKDTMLSLVLPAIEALNTFRADSIVNELQRPGNLLLCNRLYLLNLAAIYTTGFDGADANRTIPELRYMMHEVRKMYNAYNADFPAIALNQSYLSLYDSALSFIDRQDSDYSKFDHFTFIKNYVNPLFRLNQGMIRAYNVSSHSYNDYSLENDANSIFDKRLYTGQNTAGIFSLVEDRKVKQEIIDVGKLLFYDPILSGNNERSCASCHKPEQYFTDTTVASHEIFGHGGRLERNTPSLINVLYNHLLMLDGRHTTLQDQAKDVMTNSNEMAGANDKLLVKVMSCKEYRQIFKSLLQYTPEEKEVTIDHIISALTMYYGRFSNFYSPFDDAMNKDVRLTPDAISGFNLFMGKAKCGTCHYIPQFAGVPPPYISSEFEVVGTPSDTNYTALDKDKGRYAVNPAFETNAAFRVPTVRNTAHTKPYMHNGVFHNLEQLIDFYDAGGGAGRGLNVPTQTLSSDSLKLTGKEKKELLSFIRSLDEQIIVDTPPARLPASTNKALNDRRPGGIY